MKSKKLIPGHRRPPSSRSLPASAPSGSLDAAPKASAPSLIAAAPAWALSLTNRETLSARTEAFRLPALPVPEISEGIPPWILEAFGPVWVGYDYGGGVEALRAFAAALPPERLPAAWVVLDRHRSTGRGRESPVWLRGAETPQVRVREGAIQFEIAPSHPGNPGLFLDTRPLREVLIGEGRGRSVLNLFAYTCSLGVAAALAGGSRVVNVDISKPYLEWGRRNAALNGLQDAAIEYRAMEAERYVAWALGKGLVFDTVILDPPVFSQTGRGIYRFEKDYFRLVRDCARLLAPGGILYALTNFTRIGEDAFAREAAKASGGELESVRRLEPAEDFLPRRSHASPAGGCLAFRIKRSSR